jgi:hypothetical protein
MDKTKIIRNKINKRNNVDKNIKQEKKPFNKKKYREQKYSNKYKGKEFQRVPNF